MSEGQENEDKDFGGIMNIIMIGIDHSIADISLRELFAWSQDKKIDIIKYFVSLDEVNGCVIITTCNRSEIWFSTTVLKDNLLKMLLNLLHFDNTDYDQIFVLRKNKEAIKHLFRLSCGLESKIMGEDQILTQIKDSLVLSRDNLFADSFIEVLFNSAIKVGKKLRTEVKLPRLNHSIVNSVINMLKGFHKIHSRKVLVIGSGAIGKEIIQRLINEHASVTVAMRANSNHLHIPSGCEIILLEDGIVDSIQNSDIVISATLSSNVIISKSMFENAVFSKKITFIDLAIPRDIEPDVSKMNNAVLYNIDDFEVEKSTELFLLYERAAETLIDEGIQQYSSWSSIKVMLPVIERILDLSCEENKQIEIVDLSNERASELKDYITKKTTKKILFELSRYLSSDTYQECIVNIEKIYLNKK